MATILLVEPERNLRLLLTEELTEGGHIVCAVSTAEQAIDRLQAAAPDLMILEVVLPQAAGPRLLTRVLTSYSGLPVIVHTTSEDSLGSVMSALVDACVLKRSDVRPLLKAVERVLRRTVLFSAPWRGSDLPSVTAAIN